VRGRQSESWVEHPRVRTPSIARPSRRLDDLPPPPDGPGDDAERAAGRAVAVLVRELNDLLNPVLDQLESEIPGRPHG